MIGIDVSLTKWKKNQNSKKSNLTQKKSIWFTYVCKIPYEKTSLALTFTIITQKSSLHLPSVSLDSGIQLLQKSEKYIHNNIPVNMSRLEMAAIESLLNL